MASREQGFRTLDKDPFAVMPAIILVAVNKYDSAVRIKSTLSTW